MKILMFLLSLLSLNLWAQTGVQNTGSEVDQNLKREKCKVIGINATTNVGTGTVPKTNTQGTKKN